MDHSKKANYLFSIDALRVLAIFAVVMIHVSTKTLSFSRFDIENLPLSLILNQTSRFAVPLFFLISGFVLELNNKNSLSFINFFKKRASRIITPFLFWSTIYFLFSANFDISKIFSQKFIWSLILGNASYHLYFIPTLILFYLSFPILHRFIEVLKNPVFIALIVAIQGYILYVDYYIHVWDLQYDLRIALLSFAMFILGMTGSHYINFISKITKKFNYLISLFLIAIITFINFHVYEMTIKLKTTKFIYNQYGPLNYIYTASLAIFLFNFFNEKNIFTNFIIKLSKLSFFVFFVHVMIQNLIWINIIEPFIELNGRWLIYQVWIDIFLFLSISFISFVMAFILHRIPYASKITG